MERGLLVMILCMLMSAVVVYAADNTPVTYHQPFDTIGDIQDLAADDWIEKTRLKTIAERRWDLTEGRFGRALFLGAVPLKYDVDNMSGLDLDMVTAVVFNVAYAGSKGRGYDEPFIWGAGKCHPARGAVSFWVKGSSQSEDPDARTVLFEQTTSGWGRKERQLIEVELFHDRTISAYVEDARYVQHTVKSGPVWRDGDWNHVLFMWDRSSGVSLWINGAEAASTMGADAWWENQRPGLFHLPMARAAYDELYMFGRVLTPDEIGALYRENEAPTASEPVWDPDRNMPPSAFSSDVSRLPVAKPAKGTETLVFTDIEPERIHDDGITGWWVSDGRYEMAWPHETSVFTIIPGDVDFHAEKADVLPPEGADINYVTFEGNLDGVTLLKGDREGSFTSSPVLRVPEGEGFFYGAMVDNLGDSELRVPFTKGYGAPPGFTSDGDVLRLPQSGDLRLHEMDIYNVAVRDLPSEPGDEVLHFAYPDKPLADERYAAAYAGMYPTDVRLPGRLEKGTVPTGDLSWDLFPMTPSHVMTEPVTGKAVYDTVLLDTDITALNGTVLQLSVRNPAVPSQRWSHAEVRLSGFDQGGGRLRLALKMTPLCLAEGDRLWLEIMATDYAEIIISDSRWRGNVTLRPALDWASATDEWAMKTLRPAILTYGRSFEYIPWQWDNEMPDVDAPVNFGGMFDMAYPWQAVLKVDPGHKVANIYRAYTEIAYPSEPPRRRLAYPQGRYPADMNAVSAPAYDAPAGAPDWAVYFRHFQTFRNRIVTWWRHHQRSDGQAGGGWNDDTLIFSRAFGDMPLDSNPDALALYNNAFGGFDKTNYFKGGYCRIHPIDRLHNGDFVRERYKSLVYNLGDPRSAVWSMEEAWHWGKPEQTPINYGNGKAFLFGKDVLEWYWGRRRVEEPYRLTNRIAMTAELGKSAAAANDTTLWRFTEAWCHTDDQSPYGVYNLLNVLLGGWGVTPTYSAAAQGVVSTRENSNVTVTVGVGWIEGGGPDLGRMVTYSGVDGLEVDMYSFRPRESKVTARLYRLDPGTYRVRLMSGGDVLTDETMRFRRFDRLTFMVPPKKAVTLSVTQINADQLPGPRPDLAISPYFVERDGGKVTVTVHNIGDAPSGPFTVSLVSGGGVVSTVEAASLDGAGDFVPQSVTMKLNGAKKGRPCRIVVDPDGDIDEIFEENNEVVVE